MTQEEYNQFREDFQSIVWWRGQVTTKRRWVTNLHAFDKNGSHKAAIERAIEDLNNAKAILKSKTDKLEMTYEQMKECSKKISYLLSRIKMTTNNVNRYEKMGLKHKMNQAKGSLVTAQLNFENFKLHN